MQRQLLHENWTLRPVGDLSEVPAHLRYLTISAAVPGCVHTALLAAGKIPDPYRDFNEHALRWIGRTDWQYTLSFDADEKLFEHERIDLVADGLDTVATIELNGALVARTQNMHRGYRFDIRALLRKGANALVITFASPVKYAVSMRQKLGPRPYVNGAAGPFNFIRKMACNFGWDWGPALPTSGIWRPIWLEGCSQLEIVHRKFNIDFKDDIAVVDCDLLVTEAVRDPSKIDLLVRLKGADGKVYEGSDAWDGHIPMRLGPEILINDPQRWWPRGYGAQPLYDVAIEFRESRKLLYERSGRIGLRAVELDTAPDAIGRQFVIKVNGKPIFCKGFNWIPDDCFLDRACDPARVRQRIQQAVDAGANMLRVWGGGIYETDDFYNVCDELGVLVWQDFPFACAMYPEEEPFWSEVEAEARDNVARLSHHPSLAIWNGCNENIWAYCNWGWKDHEDVKGKTWGKNFYLDLLPRVVKELDPSRPYWAASPWSGDENIDNGLAPNLSTHGNKHVWEAWFNQNYDAYRQFAPRFCSEFGFQGPANFASIASIISPDRRDLGSREMRDRQKSGDPVRDDGDRRNLRHLIRNFNLTGAEELLKSLDPPDPKAPIPAIGCAPLHAASKPSNVNFDDLHYLLQLNQARALTLGVEWFRSRQPTCMGTLYWQLNDCWPGAMSWSCIDGDGKAKPLWYATRRFYAPRLLTIQPEADALVLYANNDSDEAWSDSVRIRRMDFLGKVLGDLSQKLDAPPRTNVRMGVLPIAVAMPRDRTRELIVAQSGDIRATWFFAPDKDLNYPPVQFDATLSGSQLAITPSVLMRDIVLAVDRIDPAATVDDNLITLLPGQTHVFRIKSQRELLRDQLIARPVLQCANPFGASSM